MRRLVPHFVLDQFAAGVHSGRLTAATLFVDIQGFTPLTEALFRHRHNGAESLSKTLGAIFGPLVGQVYAAGGFVPLYAGDAFTAIFPVENGDEAEAVGRAWETAVFIQSFCQPGGRPRSFATPYGAFAIGVKVGLACGEVAWGIPGRADKYTFYFRGPAIAECAQAQQQGRPGQIIAHQSIVAQLARITAAVPLANPIYHLATPASQSDPAPARLSALPAAPSRSALYPFISNSILDLPLEAEFRDICPVFISFELPADPDPSGLHRWLADVIELAQRYGGTFSQLLFDELGGLVLLYFGAPHSHENNVIRAAECLLALQKETTRRLEPPGGLGTIRWRAGLTYGLVWAGFMGATERIAYGATGDVVNTAHRIVYRAGWQEIWLDEVAAGHLETTHQLQPLGTFPLKGKQDSHPLYRLLAAKPVLNILYRGDMIGRQRELETLRAAIEPINSGRFGGILYVHGDAGMGKSRLLYELERQLGDDVIWLRCPADEILRQPLNPFRTCLQHSFHQSAEQDYRRNLANFESTLEMVLAGLKMMEDGRAEGLHEELKRTRSLLAALAGLHLPGSLYDQLEAQLRFENTLIALGVFIRALALLRPVVLHLEDGHWFDADSQQFVAMLSRQVVDYPLVILCASRFGEDGRPIQLPVAADTPQNNLVLTSLDDSAIRAIAEQLLQRPVNDSVVRLLAEKSNGRPFFAEQLTLDLQERGALERQNGHYTLAEGAQSNIPATLNALLINRLDRLDPPVKQVVQTAAILGEHFMLPVLKTLLRENSQLPQQLQDAAQKQIWVVQDELRYLFRHILLRDAAYGMQLKARRRKLHYAAAKALQALYATDLAPRYGEVAYHYEAAYQQGSAAARLPACMYLQKAGEQAAGNYENEAAVAYFGRALKLAPKTAADLRYQLLLAREDLYHLQAKRQEQAQELASLVAMVGRGATNSLSRQAEVRLRQARYAGTVSNYGETIAAAQEAIALAKQMNHISLEVMGHLEWATALRGRGEFVPAQQHLEQGLALARQANDQPLEAKCLGNLAILLRHRELSVESIYYGEQALGRYRELGDRRGEAAMFNSLGVAYRHLGDHGATLHFYQASLEICREIGYREGEGMALNNLGDMARTYGDYEEAMAYFQRDLQICQETNYLLGQLITYLNLNVIARQVEGYADALAHGRHAGEMAKQINSPFWEGVALTTIGHALAGLERWSEAAEAHQQALALLEGQQLAIDSQAGLAYIYLAEGRLGEAVAQIEPVIVHLDKGGNLDGTEDPFRILLTCYQVLAAAGDPRAKGVLAVAYGRLQAEASTIHSPEERRKFLERVPVHRELMAAVEN